ncbi:rhodanese-like domain-containing protein [Macrococcus caseolyticus]|nr:rhodanese-like domain-containing protein [Macrococcus caseolyticus]
MTLDALQETLSTGTDAVILDVRERDEYQSGHIPVAKNMPLSELEMQIDALNQDHEYIIICKKGGRASRAGEYLDHLGYNVTVAESGMDDWKGDIKIDE